MSTGTSGDVTTAPYEELRARFREAALIASASRTLAWDQETMMPTEASAGRAEQLRALAGIEHELMTSSELGDLLARCESDERLAGDARVAANLREMRRDYDHRVRLPGDLVSDLAECASLGLESWKRARADDDFEAFLPSLERTFELNRRKAECLGIPEGGDALYDALLDEYEPGMTASRTESIFAPLRGFTVDLVERVRRAGAEVDTSAVTRAFPLENQRELVRSLASAVGYDLEAGRIDDATHPFCEGIAPGDTRITNRYREDGWADSVSSGLHETGHALYEQNLPKGEHFGEPLGSAISLGIHESQSRMLENLIGRSLPFWEWAIGRARSVLGPGLEGMSPERIHRALNVVEPSFIRVEADEVTYNLHVMLRFDLERAMLSGDLSCADLPGAWNDRMKRDFGLDVTSDREGCLQDIHWSMGAVGYFATYSFGNLYSAQFWETMGEEIPDRDELIRRGEFAPVLGWLREKIHSTGRQFKAGELCERVTGKPLSHEALKRHLEQKVRTVYGV